MFWRRLAFRQSREPQEYSKGAAGLGRRQGRQRAAIAVWLRQDTISAGPRWGQLACTERQVGAGFWLEGVPAQPHVDPG
jgi:hypothetical protein